MIRANSKAGKELFGLFESDDQGIVLYSRSHLEGQLGSGLGETDGQDFYEAAKFENPDDSRRYCRLTGTSAADSFAFDCIYRDKKDTTWISLTRGHGSIFDHCSGVEIMDIHHRRLVVGSKERSGDILYGKFRNSSSISE